MNRNCFRLGVAVFFTVIANIHGFANGPIAKFETKAQQIFDQTDIDGDVRLNLNEQVQADLLTEKAIQDFVKDHTISEKKKPLPAVPEPIIADPKAMTKLEFTLHFEAMASQKDASLRTAAKIKHLQPIGLASTPVVSPFGGKNPQFGSFYAHQQRASNAAPENRPGKWMAEPDQPVQQTNQPARQPNQPAQQPNANPRQDFIERLPFQMQPLHENSNGQGNRESRPKEESRKEEKHEKTREEPKRHGHHDK